MWQMEFLFLSELQLSSKPGSLLLSPSRARKTSNQDDEHIISVKHNTLLMNLSNLCKTTQVQMNRMKGKLTTCQTGWTSQLKKSCALFEWAYVTRLNHLSMQCWLDRSISRFTNMLTGFKDCTLRVLPASDWEEIRDKAGILTLDDGVIAGDDILLGGVSLVNLTRH